MKHSSSVATFPLYRVVQPVPWGFAHEEYTDTLTEAIEIKRKVYLSCSRYKELPRIEIHKGNGVYLPWDGVQPCR